MSAVSRPTVGAATEESRLSVGVTIWLVSELMFFSALFGAYFTLRLDNAVWPPPDVHLDTFRAGLFTLLLVGSSFTFMAAERAFERDDRQGAVRWIGASIILGSVFLANQVLEYMGLGFSISSHAYGSIYYLMTGFHGLHVLGGLALMAIVAGRLRYTPTRRDGAVLRVSGYYWHFVDVVWIALFATIFLIR